MNSSTFSKKYLCAMLIMLFVMAFFIGTAFAGELILPQAITSIEKDAFCGDTSLEKVVLPEGIESIGERAFASSSLTEINLPATISYIADDAFYATTLERVDVDMRSYAYNWLVGHGYKELVGKTPAEEFDYNETLGGIAITKYKGDRSVVVIPESINGLPVTRINSNAFANNAFIREVALADSIERIDRYAFANCGLTRIHFSYNNCFINNAAFSGCSNLVGYGASETEAKAVFKRLGYTYIVDTESDGNYTFEVMTSRRCRIISIQNASQSLTIPTTSPSGKTIYEIGANAFYGNQQIETCVLPDGIYAVKSLAFANSTLKHLDFPKSLKSIATDAFANCESVVGRGYDFTTGSEFFRAKENTTFEKKYVGTLVGNFYYEAIDSQTCSITGYVGTADTLTIPQYSPDGKTVVEIGESAFGHHAELTGKLIFPDTVTKIGDYAFADTAFTIVKFSPFLSYISDSAFSFCTGFLAEVEEGCYAYDYCDRKYYLARNDETVEGLQVVLQSNNTYTIAKYTGNASDVVLPSFINNLPVTAIADSAFTGSEISGQLVFPTRLVSIGKEAFKDCVLLTGDIVIPNSVTTIGISAFAGCSGFNGTLTLSTSLTSIASEVFYGCKNLTGALIIPDNVITIYENAFRDCAGFTSLTLGKKLYAITGGAFKNCKGLAGQLILPASLRSMPNSSEHYVDQKYDGAFEGCSKLVGNLVLPENFRYIGAYAFKSCSGLTGELIIPSSVNYLGEFSFYGCRGFSSLKLPDSLTTIPGGVFGYCYGLKGELILPKNLVLIEEGNKGWWGTEHTGAFQECSGLTGTLVIPASTETIECAAFSGCSGLTGLSFSGTAITTIGSHAFYNCTKIGGTLSIPESVTTIEEAAFRNCSKLAGELVLPSKLTTIADYSFSGCGGLTGALLIPSGVTRIRSNAFRDCRGFTSVSFPANIDAIDSGAFFNCENIAGVLELPSGLKTIGDEAFMRCKSITGELSLPTSLTTLAAKAFYECKGLTGSLRIPNGVKTIGSNCFANCSGLNGVLVLGNQTEIIEDGAFEACSGLTGNIDLPETVIEVRAYAFRNCSGFDGQILMHDNVTTLGEQAFRNCSNIKGMPHVSFNLRSVGAKVIDGMPALKGFSVVPDYVYSLNLFSQYENVIVQTEQQYTLRAEAERLLLTLMLNKAQTFSDQFKLEQQDLSPVELMLVHIPIDLLLNPDELDYQHEEAEWKLNETIGMCATNNNVTLTNVELIPEGITVFDSYYDHAKEDYFKAVDIFINMDSTEEIKFDELGNTAKGWFDELVAKDTLHLSKDMSEVKLVSDAFFINDMMTKANISQEKAEAIAGKLRLFSEFVYAQKIIKAYGKVEKYINSAINAVNTIELLNGLDSDKLAEMSRIYMESGNEITRNVGSQLKMISEGTMFHRISMLASGKLEGYAIDSVLNAITTKVISSSQTMLIAKTGLSVIDFVTGISDIPKLRRNIFYDYNLSVDAYQSFVNDLTVYLNAPSDNTFEKAYWSYITFCELMIKVQNDSINCIKFGDSTIIGGLVAMTQEEKIERSSQIADACKQWKETAQTLFGYRNSDDSEGFHAKVNEMLVE